MRSMLSRFITCGLGLGLGFGSTGLAFRNTYHMSVLDRHNIVNTVQELEYLARDQAFKQCANEILSECQDFYYNYGKENSLKNAATQICTYAGYALSAFWGERPNKSLTEELLYGTTTRLLYSTPVALGRENYDASSRRITIEEILQEALSITFINSGYQSQGSEGESTFSRYGSESSFWHLYM